ncbi:MAG TPA: gamma-glutamyl-gamma-aminobutyrate hydrolase family protein [Chthoniobacteraceae bacterium]|nr:gamma-glutamyl-gamma-aminobutyrate hydrolase family protein [Chthoniobacteraceae bacterium]
MKRVLFIQNGEYEGPGLFAATLNGLGIAVETAHAWRRDVLPDSLEGWDALAIGGGSMSAYDLMEHPFLNAEIALLREARETGRPVMGLCLGAQLMAAAYGGDVFPNGEVEIGFFDICFIDAAARDPLWSGHTSGGFRPVSWHRDTFALPPGAVHLASSALTQNQLFSLDGIHYGLQFHLEIDRPLLAEMVATEDGGGLPRHGIDPREFLRESETALPAVEAIGRSVFSRWAGLCG